jgi:hypothetical protein
MARTYAEVCQGKIGAIIAAAAIRKPLLEISRRRLSFT